MDIITSFLFVVFSSVEKQQNLSSTLVISRQFTIWVLSGDSFHHGKTLDEYFPRLSFSSIKFFISQVFLDQVFLRSSFSSIKFFFNQVFLRSSFSSIKFFFGQVFPRSSFSCYTFITYINIVFSFGLIRMNLMKMKGGRHNKLNDKK